MKLPKLRKLARWLMDLTEGDTKTVVPKPHRALIIEDERGDADWLKHLLRAERWEYEWVRSPKEADEVLKFSTFDIIILDIVFPGDRDGYVYAKELSISPSSENIPVVFVTGAPDTLIRTTKGEYLAHIVKPVSPDGLHRALKVANGLNGSSQPQPKQKIVLGFSATFFVLSAVIGNGLGNGDGWLVRILIKLLKLIQ